MEGTGLPVVVVGGESIAIRNIQHSTSTTECRIANRSVTVDNTMSV